MRLLVFLYFCFIGSDFCAFAGNLPNHTPRRFDTKKVNISEVYDPSLRELGLAEQKSDSKIERTVRSIARSYWELKNFEKPLFKALGVSVFGRYWINGGSFWTWRLSHSKFLLKLFPRLKRARKSNLRNSSKQAYKELLDFAVGVEKIHILLAVGMYLLPLPDPDNRHRSDPIKLFDFKYRMLQKA